MSTSNSLFGVYKWEYASGAFDVALRPNAVFHCPQYSSSSTWSLDNNKLSINWKNYGSYELIKSKDESSIVFDGSVKDQPTKWRKMTFIRPFNDVESLFLVS